ncbi:MAG: DNA primase, partial [Saprospiraceae bacterium]|nr:DNA primase [Saprospiraceae bacterium]
MITQQSAEQIKDAAKIEEVVSDFVNLKRRGSSYVGLCPFHNEKTPSFTVTPSKEIFKCFGCGRGGDAIQFLIEHEGYNYPEALRYLAKKYGIEVEETQQTDEERARQKELDSLFIVMHYARDYFQQQLFETDRGKSVALSYFTERGYTEETLRKFDLGYAPAGGDEFTRQALSDGHDQEVLKQLGLCTDQGRDFFRDRVIFPIHNLSGKVIAFAGRTLKKNKRIPKYINSPETEIYNKRKVLYGTHQARPAIRKEKKCILTEGYTDVLSLHQAGIQNVVASSGTALTEDQVRRIKQYAPQLLLLYDGDPAGIKAAERGLDLALGQNLDVEVVLLPEEEDPDSFLKRLGTKEFKSFIESNARDFLLVKTERLLKESGGDPIKKTQVIKELVESLARIPDPLKRSVYVQKVAEEVEISEDVIVQEVNRMLSRQLKKDRSRQSRTPITTGGPASSERAETPSEKPAEAGDEFQEKDLVRILISGGEKMYDEEEKMTVAQFILENIEDVRDEFDHPLYRQIIDECYQLLQEGRSITESHFVRHEDGDIRKLAADFLSSPYEYSKNWEKKWNVFLQTQKMPDENFHKDATDSIRRFKLRKLDKMIRKNAERLKEAYESDTGDIFLLLKVDQRLKKMRNELAAQV